MKKELKKLLKKEKGITLVALIITVILMLILAGVAISAVIDGGGLFSKSREATQQYENAAKAENKTISNLMNYVERYLSVESVSSGNGMEEETEDTAPPTLAELSLVEGSMTSTSFTLNLIGQDETKIAKYELYINGSKEDIIESSDTNIIYEIINKVPGSKYVCNVIVYDIAGNLKESEEISVNTYSAIGSLNTQNQTFNALFTGTYDNPIIPKGFAPINENGAIWGSENGYKYGLVITDAYENGVSTGNEFVWVPVDGSIVTFERKNWGNVYNQSSRAFSSYSDPADTLADETLNVTSNGGFYIGRYETGIEGTDTVVVKKGVMPHVNITFQEVLGYSKIYTTTDEKYGANSLGIWGTNWDTTLKFIEAYDIGEEGYSTYATNSMGLGNFSGDEDGYAEMAPTGAEDNFRQKNIYDMAGNVWEWTRELYVDYNERVRRGGSYATEPTEIPACYRYSNAPNTTGGARGYRIVLFIKES